MTEEKECYNSPDGKHHYQLIKSGMKPLYGCKYCFRARGKTTICPNCGHPVTTDEEEYWHYL